MTSVRTKPIYETVYQLTNFHTPDIFLHKEPAISTKNTSGSKHSLIDCTNDVTPSLRIMFHIYSALTFVAFYYIVLVILFSLKSTNKVESKSAIAHLHDVCHYFFYNYKRIDILICISMYISNTCDS